MSDTLVNKIAESGLITLRPEDWVQRTQPAVIDLKDFLFMELILKEKDFREMMKTHDWAQYKDQPLCVFCSTDAIIPSWAFMLISTNAIPFTQDIFFGTPEQRISQQLLDYIHHLDVSQYHDQRVIIKGCSDDVTIGPEIYMALTNKLVPVVKSLMFGEPCSTVPVYKRPKGVL
ncbi:MAG TPA: DUF2480 family protein [Saprospiraceae bacterium]|nr:DUF2480 family protein [Saprospiraceae bacterium]